MTEIDILADAEAAPPPRPGVPCAITRMRAEKPSLAEQWDRLTEGIDRLTRRWPKQRTDKWVAGWFTAKGFDLDHQVVTRHRLGECKTCRAS